MKKNLIFIVLILSFAFLLKCQDEQEPLEEKYGENYDYDDGYDGDAFFKESLKDYLLENKLFDSERLIQPDEMRKIFLDVITNGDPEGPEYINGVFIKLTDYFIELYYKEKKEIKGKDIYDLIDISAISMKFEELIGDNPYYEGFDGEENDYDSQDGVGDPNPDV